MIQIITVNGPNHYLGKSMGSIELYDYQNDIAAAIYAGKNIILQAPTGAGKTFASLYPFFQSWADRGPLPRKCIYSVPMRVLANQFYEEYDRLVSDRLQAVHRPVIKRQTGEYQNDPEFRADITFATIDQVLSSWLMHPYSLSKRKGNLNAGAFVGSYLIFDEFHLFDADSTLPTTLHMLKMLKGVSPFLLMTATFSADMLKDLAEQLDAVPFLLRQDQLANIKAQNKTRTFHTATQPLVSKESADVQLIIDNHVSQPEDYQRSMVVCNQVERAQRVYQHLTAHPDLHEQTEVILLHARFLKADRQAIEAQVRQEFHRDRDKHTLNSVILIGTQTVEVGLDMSSPVLHTEIAPAAAVLQRAGRCARYEKEVGRVFVYPVADENYAPYSGKETQKQCLLTWEWLEQNQNRHIDFTSEQALINHAHTDTDKKILDGLRGGAFTHKEVIESLWRGESSERVGDFVREIQAISLIVHDDLDAFTQSPFKAESFSLYPGTLQGKFTQWVDANNALDPDFDDGYLPWLACYLTEEKDLEDAESNRPIRYDFAEVKQARQLHAPLIAVHPNLVDYSKKIGLTFNGGGRFKTAVPVSQQQVRQAYGYRLESYEEHIRLVHAAYAVESQETVAAAGQRLEAQFGWPPGCVAKMAELVVMLHDVGKLSRTWQKWATDWQKSAAVNNQMPERFAAAHTDYDPSDEAQRVLNNKMRGKRPHHAVEGAVAAHKMLALNSPTKRPDHPLVRAAFSAIARHHAAFSSMPQDYVLVENFEHHIGRSFADVGLEADLQGKFRAKIDVDKSVRRKIEDEVLIRTDNPADVLSYMVFVRALRFADQKGTQEGSK